MDAGLVSVVIAVVSTLGGLVALYLRLRWQRKPAAAADRSAAAEWRGEAELWQARAGLVAEERDEERSKREAAERTLASTRHDLDDCTRQRDDAYSELRLIGRRRTRAQGDS